MIASARSPVGLERRPARTRKRTRQAAAAHADPAPAPLPLHPADRPLPGPVDRRAGARPAEPVAAGQHHPAGRVARRLRPGPRPADVGPDQLPRAGPQQLRARVAAWPSSRVLHRRAWRPTRSRGSSSGPREFLMIAILGVLMLPAVATIAPLFIMLNGVDVDLPVLGTFNLRAVAPRGRPGGHLGRPAVRDLEPQGLPRHDPEGARGGGRRRRRDAEPELLPDRSCRSRRRPSRSPGSSASSPAGPSSTSSRSSSTTRARASPCRWP